MPTKRDNDDERAARIESLLEEYRTKTEASYEHVFELQHNVRTVLRHAKARIADNRRHLAARKR